MRRKVDRKWVRYLSDGGNYTRLGVGICFVFVIFRVFYTFVFKYFQLIYLFCFFFSPRLSYREGSSGRFRSPTHSEIGLVQRVETPL